MVLFEESLARKEGGGAGGRGGGSNLQPTGYGADGSFGRTQLD